jgi:glycosyltransferase involved in cell wall biosynthesis
VIAISLLTLVPGRLGGSETYVRELLRALDRVGDLDYRVVVPPLAAGSGESLPALVVDRYPRARSVPARLAGMTLATIRPTPLRRAFGDAEVVHYPLTVQVPPADRPSVVTLHDLQHLDLPGLFSAAERRFRAVAWHRSLRRADRVVAISEFVRGRALAALGLPPERVRVVPLGLDHETLRPSSGPRERFLLYPARRWRHKNHERLFEAFTVLRAEHPDLRLVLTGGGDYPDAPAGVEALGRVPWPHVVDLMQRASALVFPSLYEGFGLPPLEAMACGCPVACSDAAALPETVGDAARLFDPRDPRAIAAAVREVLTDPDPWVTRGLERARAFSWDATARGTEAVYRELSTRS